VLRDARAVFFTCEEERLLARRSFRPYRCREEVIGFGTAPAPMRADVAVAALQTAYPQLRDRRLLLFLGRLHGKKGCDLLIEAFAALRERDARWQLVVAGTGDEALLAQLRALAERLGVAPALTWTGLLDGALKWGALHAAEVFALPSHQENFGVAVVEALACGTPVLISDKVNIWREIEQDGAGFIAPDTLAGTRALLLRWQDLAPQERRLMRERAVRCFDRRFHADQAARRMTDAIERLRRPAAAISPGSAAGSSSPG
jgi:glycosyltransferase involved in cell wall biosynthesis